MRLAAMSSVVSFFCRQKEGNEPERRQVRWRRAATHVVFQPLDHLDAVVAQVELSEADQVLQTLQFSDPITLHTNVWEDYSPGLRSPGRRGSRASRYLDTQDSQVVQPIQVLKFGDFIGAEEQTL